MLRTLVIWRGKAFELTRYMENPLVLVIEKHVDGLHALPLAKVQMT